MRAINQPTSWWGWHWEPPVPMSIIEVIRAGNLSARLASLFWIGLERGASILVAADPPSSGKTTTLSALLAFTPPETLVYFTRGVGETFALPPVSKDHPTYLLINEMSDHIPVYTWDDNARRAFDLLDQGYGMATTMHDETASGVIAQLQRDLSIPREQIANLTFIVPMFVGHGPDSPFRSTRFHPQGNVLRRVREVVFLRRNGGDLAMSSIAAWQPEPDDFELFPEAGQREAFADWARLSPEALESELSRREGFLRTLDKTGVTSIQQVNAAIEAYYEQVIRAKNPA